MECVSAKFLFFKLDVYIYLVILYIYIYFYFFLKRTFFIMGSKSINFRTLPL